MTWERYHPVLSRLTRPPQALPGATLRVFSRWGQQVFSTDAAAGTAPRWDGTGATADEYFWELRYANRQGQPQHRKGGLALVR